jgi:hypothetical protein
MHLYKGCGCDRAVGEIEKRCTGMANIRIVIGYVCIYGEDTSFVNKKCSSNSPLCKI